ncbi:hypothetical protein GCM10027089_42930 [Nocardia thraciensis]
MLLLDEATVHADGITETAIHECIRQRAQVGAVITVAHRLSTVVDADHIVVLQDGRIRAQGSHAELVETDELSANWCARCGSRNGPRSAEVGGSALRDDLDCVRAVGIRRPERRVGRVTHAARHPAGRAQRMCFAGLVAVLSRYSRGPRRK